MRFFCLGDEDTVRGFRLAGVQGQVVHSATEACAALRAARAQPEVGLLVVTQRIAMLIPKEVDSFRLDCERPLLVLVPGAEGVLPQARSLADIVHAAVGIRVDFEKGHL